MKITTFDPIIVSSKSEDIVKLFEELGFEQQHHLKEIENRYSTRMKNANGFHLDVSQMDELAKDQQLIRMNVDNLEEAHDLLIAHGFTAGPRFLDVTSLKSLSMISPSGFIIVLVEHKKDHD